MPKPSASKREQPPHSPGLANAEGAEPNANPAEDRQQVTALARGLQILRCFTTTRTQLGSAELARLTGLPQPTVWRLCRTLLNGGFLDLAPGTQRLQLGTSVLALGFAASAAYDVLESVRPRMQELADYFNAAFSIAGREGLDMVYLQRCEAEARLTMNLQRGSRIPIARTTLGWAYLAGLSEPARNAVLRQVRRSNPEQWPAIEVQVGPALRDFERKGFVLRRGLSHPEIIAAAVPIVAANGAQVLAINCSGHRSDVTIKQLETQVAPHLKDLAQSISATLSRRAPSPERPIAR